MDVVQARTAGDVTPQRLAELVDCWVAVSDQGGAVGFPFIPVDRARVAAAADAMVSALAPAESRLLLCLVDGALAGWLQVSRSLNPLVAHWGTIARVQTHPLHRGKGIGIALMREVRRVARDELDLEQLHLAVRGGTGTDRFYARLGYVEIGRWPAALRLADGDDRDEILMQLRPL
jgi:GNAT superfamily N-acetyltransferase